MKQSTYRDMHLLNEVTNSPDATQRELSQRIGAALGLTNLMLRRLAKKGYIKITGTKRSRIRYLITPQGILEKSRLTYEFIHYSLQLYGRVRSFLREQLTQVAKAGHRRIVLCGTNELAEIAFLTIHEMGLELVGVVDDAPSRQQFLGRSVRSVAEIGAFAYDRMVVASLRWGDGGLDRLAALGVPMERLIVLPESGFANPNVQTAALDRMLANHASAVSLPETSEAISLAEPRSH
ncbi:MAG: winged helix-turn-helix transcriptional regulator [Candidatus Omnitrophica bacterium]|nr:winged helix-turn-helix transcriptional regulator [Candidatus Omnitrophota bacterium]